MFEHNVEITKATDCLNAGKLVAIPTETVYGLAANAFNEKAVATIFAVKNRPRFNPLIIHSNSLQRFESWGITIPEVVKKLAEQFSPGPITYVVPASQAIPELVTAGHQSVAIRIPNHPLTLNLLSRLNYPLAAPSANPSGYVSPTTAAHVAVQLGNKVCHILDGGPCKVGIESTIISLVQQKPVLLRHGAITVNDIEKVLNQQVEVYNTFQNNSPLAPGMLSKHYATKTQLILAEDDSINLFEPENTGAIRFCSYHPLIPKSNQYILAEDGDLITAAANLYAAMRMLDNKGFKLIIAQPVPNEGIGVAINDRLQRASIKE